MGLVNLVNFMLFSLPFPRAVHAFRGDGLLLHIWQTLLTRCTITVGDDSFCNTLLLS